MLDLQDLRISARLMAEEAVRQGYDVRQIVLGYGYLVIDHKTFKQPLLIRSTNSPATSFISGSICDNKWVFFNLLKKHGLSTADTEYIEYENQDKIVPINDMLQKYSKVVIKPIDTNHGEAVSMNITDMTGALAAVEATQLASRADGCIVQEQRSGKDFRFLVVDGKFIAAAERRPAHVTGDGKHSVLELIHEKNTHPHRGEGHSTKLTKIDIELVKQYLTTEQLEHVPPKAEEVEVMAVANLSKGGEAIDLTDRVHPELKELACQVAQALQMGVCGVDILTSDPTLSIADGGAIVLEANTCPGIRMHHFPSVGEPRNVAKIIFESMVSNHLKQQEISAQNLIASIQEKRG